MLNVGAGSAVITPPSGLDMEGYLREGPAVGVLDDLRCQAVVFDDGEMRLVLAVCDLIGITVRLRERVCARLDLPPGQVMLTATHTHCGPGHLAIPGHDDLLGQLADGITAAVSEATAALRPVRLVAGVTDVVGVAANRRRSGGPVDPAATFVAALPATGAPLDPVVTIVNFACHATILDAETRSYSADFPGVARHAIETLCGGRAVFLQGAAGDINPVRADRTSSEIRRTGAILGASVASEILIAARSLAAPYVINPSDGSAIPVAVSARASLVSPAPLRSSWTDVAVEPRDYRPLEVIRAERAEASGPARVTELWVEEFIASRTGFDSFDFPAEPARLPVQVFRLGADLVLVGLPGEPFTATAQQLRASCRGRLMVAGYANQAAGYLPTQDECLRGGFETACSTHAPGTAERLSSAAIQLVSDLNQH